MGRTLAKKALGLDIFYQQEIFYPMVKDDCSTTSERSKAVVFAILSV